MPTLYDRSRSAEGGIVYSPANGAISTYGTARNRFERGTKESEDRSGTLTSIATPILPAARSSAIPGMVRRRASNRRGTRGSLAAALAAPGITREWIASRSLLCVDMASLRIAGRPIWVGQRNGVNWPVCHRHSYSATALYSPICAIHSDIEGAWSSPASARSRARNILSPPRLALPADDVGQSVVGLGALRLRRATFSRQRSPPNFSSFASATPNLISLALPAGWQRAPVSDGLVRCLPVESLPR